MTALTMASAFGFSADELAFDERIRAKANKIVCRMITVITDFWINQASSAAPEVEHRFDQIMNSANDSLEKVLVEFSGLITNADMTLDRINESINVVKVGDCKITETTPVEPLLRLSYGLTEQMAFTFRQTRRQIESVNISRISVAKSIDLLKELESNCLILCKKLDEVSERVHIRDAMTEKPLLHSGISELDALNDL